MALTKTQQSRCRACNTFLPRDPIHGEVWVRYCPECGFPCELDHDAWTVLTSGPRILVLGSPEEVKSAAEARLIDKNDLVFPPGAPELPVSDLLDAPESTVRDVPETLDRRPDKEEPRRPSSRRPALSHEAVAAIDDLLREPQKRTPPFLDWVPFEPTESGLFDSPESDGSESSERDLAPAAPVELENPQSAKDKDVLEEPFSPPSEVPLTLDNASLGAERPTRLKVPHVWISALLVASGACAAAWLYVKNDSPPPPEQPERHEHPDPALSRARVTADLETLHDLVKKRLKERPADPQLLSQYARVANELADEQWILAHAHLMNPTEAPLPNKRNLAESAADALWGATQFHDAVRSPEAVLEKLNALRTSGQIDQARAMVQQVEGLASSTAANYALGALALTDPEADPQKAQQHLEAALDLDSAPGRVRAALVLAHIRAGDWKAAEKHLALLKLLTRTHPATETLARLLQTKRKQASPVEKESPPPPPRQPISYLLQAADKAARQGSDARARRLYHLVLARDADNCDARSGLQALEGREPLCRPEQASSD